MVAEYAKPLVEDPRKNSDNDSSIIDDLPASFAICESRMNKLMAKNTVADDNDEEEDEDEQKTLLHNLITNLRESHDEEFDLEDVDHDYMSDSDEEEEFPEVEFDPLQYASVRTLALQDDEINMYEDRNFWRTSHVSCDADELLKLL